MDFCDSCNGKEFRFVLDKRSIDGKNFRIVECSNCSLVQVNPRPSLEECEKYYTNHYFTNRTHRGYDNYYSDSVRQQIRDVYELNLKDLDFFSWEKTLKEKKSLDIGCAAGYFVEYMQDRNWESFGMDVSKDALNFAKNTLNVNVIHTDFLRATIEEKYNLISLWATIEHLQNPKKTLEKIYSTLSLNGGLLLSTCRYGILAKLKGVNWRFMNVPEHLFFYSVKNLLDLCREIGFEVHKFITYGSGFTSKKNATYSYLLKKALADKLVKVTHQGDMIAVFLKKR